MSSTKLIRVRQSLGTARWPVVVAAILLLVGLPLATWLLADRQAAVSERARAAAVAERAGRAVERRVQEYVRILRGAIGLLAAVPDPSPAAWQAYAEAALADANRSGRGLLWAPRDGAAWRVAMVYPAGPATGLIGSDLAADPAVATAIARAVTTGAPTLSGRQQRPGTDPAELFVVMPAVTGGAVRGVVAIPFHVDDLAAETSNGIPESASIGIVDATDAQATILVLLPMPAVRAGPPVTETRPVAGRTWALHVRATRHPFDLFAATPWILSGAAFLLGGLGLLMLVQLRQRQARATRMAERMTADLRATQAELRAALAAAQEAASAKDGFLAMMSHELRTPLNGVIGMTNLLLDGELTAEQRDFAETARGCANGLLEVIDDILDYSKLEAGKVRVENTSFDPRELVEEVLQVVADRVHRKGLELAAEVDPRLGSRLRGDPSRLRQLLLNLLANAVKFTERGEVVVSMRLARDDAARPLVRMAVRDTGIGISAEQLGRLFQPFTQADNSISRRFGGTGLGLAICKRLAEAMGGRIAATSESGAGSEFSADIPLDREAPVDSSAPPSELAGRLAVIIDDHPVARASVAAILGDIGCEVIAVPTLAEAHGLLVGAVPDLVVVDASGPEHEPPQLAAAIRASAALAEVPLVFLTRFGSQAQYQVPRSAAVSKPVRRRQLRDACAAALGGKTGSGTARIPRRFPGVHVLVADARLGNLRILAAQLAELGCRCDLAADAIEAVAAASRGGHALVLLAADLPPEGASRAAGEIRAAGCTGLLITTGGARRPAAGCAGWLPSTPRMGDIVRVLAQATEGSAAPEAT